MPQSSRGPLAAPAVPSSRSERSHDHEDKHDTHCRRHEQTALSAFQSSGNRKQNDSPQPADYRYHSLGPAPPLFVHPCIVPAG